MTNTPIGDNYPSSIDFVRTPNNVEVGIVAGANPIHIYVLPNFSRQTIDCWIETMVPHIQQWLDGAFDTWLALHDLSQLPLAVSVTPYARQKFQDLAKLAPRLSGKVAFVTAPNRMMQTIAQPVVSRYVHVIQPNIEPKLFSDQASALSWLQA